MEDVADGAFDSREDEFDSLGGELFVKLGQGCGRGGVEVVHAGGFENEVADGLLRFADQGADRLFEEADVAEVELCVDSDEDDAGEGLGEWVARDVDVGLGLRDAAEHGEMRPCRAHQKEQERCADAHQDPPLDAERKSREEGEDE